MALTMYEASVPALTRSLTALSAILEKAEAQATARKIDPAVLVADRLYADMFPLSRQVQIATDQAKGCAARLGGIEVPKFEDTEKTFADLKDRIARTLAFIASVDKAAIDASADREIVISAGSRQLTFTGETYLFSWVFPNFYFHCTTAYAILRHNGIELGKRDYLGMV